MISGLQKLVIAMLKFIKKDRNSVKFSRMLILLIFFLARIALTSGMLLRVAFFQKKIQKNPFIASGSSLPSV